MAPQARRLAGISPHAAVEITCPCLDGFVEDGHEVRLAPGDCVTFVAPTTDNEPIVHLAEMLGTHLGWASGAGPPFPGQASDDRLCIVSDDRIIDFVVEPVRSMYYKADIAFNLGLRSWLLHLTPAQPAVRDSAVFGRPQRTVLTAGEHFRRGGATELVGGILDGRPLLQSWQRLYTQDGWLDLNRLRRSLTDIAPAGWHVSLPGCPAHWQWLWFQPGQILKAVFGPNCGSSDAPVPSAPVDASTLLPDVTEQASQSTDVQSSPDSSAPMTRARAAANATSGSRARGFLPLHPLFLLSLLLCASTVTEVLPLLCAYGFCRMHTQRHHSLAIVCLVTALAQAAQAAGSPCAPSTSLGQHTVADTDTTGTVRPIPTPARNAFRLPVVQDVTLYERVPEASPLLPDDCEGWDLRTLLTEAVWQEGSTAFLDARAIPEVLTEHFSQEPIDDGTDPVTVCLETQLPVSCHQQQTLQLQRFLPHCLPAEDIDWLDSDLTGVLRCRSLPLEVRTSLVNIPIWCRSGCPQPDSIEVYTDGSASSSARPRYYTMCMGFRRFCCLRRAFLPLRTRLGTIGTS